jgi:hypothetical protein
MDSLRVNYDEKGQNGQGKMNGNALKEPSHQNRFVKKWFS